MEVRLRLSTSLNFVLVFCAFYEPGARETRKKGSDSIHAAYHPQWGGEKCKSQCTVTSELEVTKIVFLCVTNAKEKNLAVGKLGKTLHAAMCLADGMPCRRSTLFLHSSWAQKTRTSLELLQKTPRL